MNPSRTDQIKSTTKIALTVVILITVRRSLRSIAIGAATAEAVLVVFLFLILLRNKGARPKLENSRLDRILQIIFKRIPEPVVRFAIMEWKILSTAVTFPWKGNTRKEKANEFSFTQTSSYPQFLVGILLLMVFEGFIVHLFVIPAFFSSHSIKVQWGLAAMEIYAFLWLLGDYLLLKQSRHRITGDHLEINFGARYSISIPRNSIERIVVPTSLDFDQSVSQAFAVRCFKRDPVTIVLALKSDTKISPSIGREKRVRYIALTLDDQEKFLLASAT